MTNKRINPKDKGMRQLHINPVKQVDAKYSNVVRISHTAGEMVMDFGLILPGDKMAQVVSKVVMSPLGIKLLQRALTDNLAKYEAKFGEVKVPKQESLADHLFQTSKGEDEPEEE
jgi:hypothetical protein